MPVDSTSIPQEQNPSKSADWLPAVLLIFLQVATGIAVMPQLSFFLIYLQEQLLLAPATISYVVAGAQVAGMLTAVLGGAITARLGTKWVLVCGLALSTLASFAFQMQSFWVVTLLWFAGGAGMALSTVGGASYLTGISRRGSLGILAALYALSMTIGGAFGNPIAGVLIERSGYAAFSWVAIGILASTILVITLWMGNQRGQTPEGNPLRFLWSSISYTFRQANVRMVVGMRCLPTIFYGTLTVLIPLLINQVTGSKVMVAVYGTTTLAVASAAQLLAGRAVDRWGARRPTLIAYSAIILSGLGLAASAGTLPGLFGFGVLGIAAAWSLSTLMYVWVNDGIPKADHPSTFGGLHAVWSLSMVSGSVLGGWFVTTLPGLPFLLTGLLNAGSIFLALAYYRRSSVTM
jgi:MFS family permease